MNNIIPVGLSAKGRTEIALNMIRHKAVSDKNLRFTSLFHLITSKDMLIRSYRTLKRKAAPGVDEVTAKEYGKELEMNIVLLELKLFFYAQEVLRLVLQFL